ncbi:MAG: hypothetical protein HOO86_00995 [Bacteroidales bacterium]|nr:hypothetical protein [Bacteroidales bacterium]
MIQNNKAASDNEPDHDEFYEENEENKEDLKKFIDRLAIQQKLLKKLVDPVTVRSTTRIENEDNPNNQHSN